MYISTGKKLLILFLFALMQNALCTTAQDGDKKSQLAVLRVSLQERDKETIVDSLFHRFLGDIKKEVLNKEAVEELDLIAFNESNKNANLSTAFGSTQTIFGKKAKDLIISNPTDDVAVLHKRQAIIAALKDNQSATAELEAQFALLKEYENDFLSFWQSEDELVRKVVQEVYYGKRLQQFNTNAHALEALRLSTYLYQGLGFISPEVYPVMVGKTVEYFGKRWYLAYVWDRLSAAERARLAAGGMAHRPVLPSVGKFLLTLPIDTAKEYVPKWIAGHNPLTKNPFTGQNFQRQTFGQEVAQFAHGGIMAKMAFSAVWLMRFGFDFWWFQRAKSAYNVLAFKESVAESLHKKMHTIARFFDALRQIMAICQEQLFIKEHFTSLSALEQLCIAPQAISEDMAQLIALLSTNTLKNEPTPLAFRGRVLAAYALMQRVKEQFAAALQAVGELEAYLAVAVKMRTQTSCFAEFIDERYPVIKATGIYNPLIQQENISQDIQLGEPVRVPNMLITGPNGCGKTTVMKTVAYGVTGAQTFGVVFAERFQLTVFHKVITYFMVKDNITQGRSTFMAEMARVQAIEQETEQLGQKKFGVAFIDEGLKGTIEEEGARLLYNFYRKLTDLSNVIFVGATHFERPTELENDTQGRVVNYHVGLLQYPDGTFRRTFTLSPGKPWWFTDQVTRARFIEWLKKQ